MHKKIEQLLREMTLEEKIGQLNQCGPSLVGAFDVPFEEVVNMVFDGRISKQKFDEMMSSAHQDFHEEDLRAGKIGSYNGVSDAAQTMRLQKIAVEESRLGIPLLFGYDVVHGFRTVTPIPLAESCAWDPELWERTARLSAEEATAAGVTLTYAPMVDVSRDARWGRVAESAGEDTLINARYGAAKVRGFQTEKLSRPDAMAACAKHFTAYGAAESGRDYNTVDMSAQMLEEVYLPPFKACVEAGAAAVMPAFNDLCGVPCTANEVLLRDILRRRWGFSGLTVSDANAVAELVDHGFAENRAEAAKLALEAGTDMDMTSGCYPEELAALVHAGTLDEKALDEAVLDILRVKERLGLFENPYRTTPQREQSALLTPAARAAARAAACRSMVLLKNSGVLPLPAACSVGLVGELAAARGEMTGTWAVKAQADDCVSMVDAAEGSGAAVQYFGNDAAQAAAADCDVFVAAVGERKSESGEAASKTNLALPEEQLAMLNTLYKTGKPVIAVVFGGRPLLLDSVQAVSEAVLMAWHPGVEAGNAIWDLLMGRVNPSAKLTVSFPAAVGQCPIYYARPATGRPAGKSKFTSKYLDCQTQPEYPFGYGLSYTTYQYSDLTVKCEESGITAQFTVENTGSRAGEEIVQCYFRDIAARRVRPVQQLADFTKIHLEPGEKQTVSFRISAEQLGYYLPDMTFVTEPGNFEIMVGGSSADCLHQTVYFS